MKHSQLEFHVENKVTGKTTAFRDYSNAIGHAVAISVQDCTEVRIDVMCYSEAAAQRWGGEEGAKLYRDDPEASVHERIIVKARSEGRIR